MSSKIRDDARIKDEKRPVGNFAFHRGVTPGFTEALPFLIKVLEPHYANGDIARYNDFTARLHGLRHRGAPALCHFKLDFFNTRRNRGQQPRRFSLHNNSPGVRQVSSENDDEGFNKAVMDVLLVLHHFYSDMGFVFTSDSIYNDGTAGSEWGEAKSRVKESTGLDVKVPVYEIQGR